MATIVAWKYAIFNRQVDSNFMTDKELEILLTERCKTLALTKTAFDNLEQMLKDNSSNKDFFCGFAQNEIKAIFDRFEYQINRRQGGSIIRTRIGLYVEDKNQVWLDNMEPIGYYELETDLKGEIIDDWFVIEKKRI